MVYCSEYKNTFTHIIFKSINLTDFYFWSRKHFNSKFFKSRACKESYLSKFFFLKLEIITSFLRCKMKTWGIKHFSTIQSYRNRYQIFWSANAMQIENFYLLTWTSEWPLDICNLCSTPNRVTITLFLVKLRLGLVSLWAEVLFRGDIFSN